MASVRKKLREQKKDGSRSEVWVAYWRDETGKQREKAFDRKRDAEKFAADKQINPDAGIRIKVADAVEIYLEHFAGLVAAGERRETTYRQKRQHLQIHFAEHPIGDRIMSEIRAKDLQAHFDRLITAGMSLALARKVVGSSRQFWKFAAVREWTADSGAASAAGLPASRSKLQVKRAEIPPKVECRAMLEAADARDNVDRGRAAALFRIVMFAGLRAGEVRALQWPDVDLERGEIRIERSADKYQIIHDRPKTDSSRRKVPIGPETLAALKRWRVACPPSKLELVFPNERGGVWRHDHIYRNSWTPVMRSAGLAEAVGKETPRSHPNGRYARTIWRPRYSPHTARHIAASIWISQSAQIGSPVTPKWIMEKMGHSSIRLSQELYGHLWPTPERDAEIAAAGERAFD